MERQINLDDLSKTIQINSKNVKISLNGETVGELLQVLKISQEKLTEKTGIKIDFSEDYDNYSSNTLCFTFAPTQKNPHPNLFYVYTRCGELRIGGTSKNENFHDLLNFLEN